MKNAAGKYPRPVATSGADRPLLFSLRVLTLVVTGNFSVLQYGLLYENLQSKIEGQLDLLRRLSVSRHVGWRTKIASVLLPAKHIGKKYLT